MREKECRSGDLQGLASHKEKTIPLLSKVVVTAIFAYFPVLPSSFSERRAEYTDAKNQIALGGHALLPLHKPGSIDGPRSFFGSARGCRFKSVYLHARALTNYPATVPACSVALNLYSSIFTPELPLDESPD